MVEKLKSLWVDQHDIRGRFTALYCYDYTWHAPLGVVWGMFRKNNGSKLFATYDSYTTSTARRMGVRTAINEYLFNKCSVDVITTGTGTEDGGLAFMKASGYVLDKRTKEYVLTKRAFNIFQKRKVE